MARTQVAIQREIAQAEQWLCELGLDRHSAMLEMRTWFKHKLAELRQQAITGRFNSYRLEDCLVADKLINSSSLGVGGPCDASVPSRQSSSGQPRTKSAKNPK